MPLHDAAARAHWTLCRLEDHLDARHEAGGPELGSAERAWLEAIRTRWNEDTRRKLERALERDRSAV